MCPFGLWSLHATALPAITLLPCLRLGGQAGLCGSSRSPPAGCAPLLSPPACPTSALALNLPSEYVRSRCVLGGVRQAGLAPRFEGRGVSHTARRNLQRPVHYLRRARVADDRRNGRAVRHHRTRRVWQRAHTGSRHAIAEPTSTLRPAALSPCTRVLEGGAREALSGTHSLQGGDLFAALVTGSASVSRSTDRADGTFVISPTPAAAGSAQLHAR